VGGAIPCLEGSNPSLSVFGTRRHRGGESLSLSCLGVVVRPQDRTAEETLARLASNAHGVVTRRELLRNGITIAEIKHRLSSGALLRVYPGVYRVGHRAPSLEARYLAAVRACGDGAILSGLAAAHLFGLVKGGPPPPEVTTPTERRIAGIRTRRARWLGPDQATTFRGVPITSVPLTLVNLASRLSLERLARSCHEASVRYGTTPSSVEAVLSQRRNSPGTTKLREILHGQARVTLSQL
jgi:hypothetical protein